MKNIKCLIFYLIVVMLSQTGLAMVPAESTPCKPRQSIFSFLFGRPNPVNPFAVNDTTQPRRYFDLTCLLPNSGTFSRGTNGWACSSTGNGCVKSYPRFGQGWVGLKVVSPGDTASIGTYNGSTTSYLNLTGKQYICDELMLCVVMRTSGGFSGNLNAKITTPNTSQPLNINGGIMADGYNSLNSGKKFVVVGFMLTPVFQDISRIKKLEISYSGTSSGNGTPSEVIIDQVYLTGVRVIP